jgi:hypothetical protein
VILRHIDAETERCSPRQSHDLAGGCSMACIEFLSSVRKPVE